MANPGTVGWRKLKPRNIGPVVCTRGAVDRFRRSLGYGYVIMNDESNAAKAIEALSGNDDRGFAINCPARYYPSVAA